MEPGYNIGGPGESSTPIIGAHTEDRAPAAFQRPRPAASNTEQQYHTGTDVGQGRCDYGQDPAGIDVGLRQYGQDAQGYGRDYGPQGPWNGGRHFGRRLGYNMGAYSRGWGGVYHFHSICF